MEEDSETVQFSNTIGWLRLFAAIIATPLVMMSWLSGCVEAVIAYHGGNPDGPARVMLGAFLLMIGLAVPSFCLLFLGLPYALILSLAGRLNVRAILLPTLPLAVLYGLLVYSSMNPDRFPSQARAVALLAAPGVPAAGLGFYVIGVWRNTPRRS